MTCKCGSDRIVTVNGKTSDMCSVRYQDVSVSGYVPKLTGIDTNKDGYGDYIQYAFCADCGHIQGGRFPMSDASIREALKEVSE